MKARRIQTSDIEAIKSIHERYHQFAFENPVLNVGSIIVEKDNQVIGAGYLRPIVEAVMILDLNAPLREKALALQRMTHQAIADASSLHLNEIHAWVKEPEFRDELIKHYGYEKPRGESLVLRI